MKKNIVKSSFAVNLSRLRKERGLSQVKLSELSGLSQRVISSYENGSVNPPIANVEILADALGVNIDDLLILENKAKNKNEYLQLDSRTMEKIKKILSLPKHERHIVYTIAEALLLKKQIKKNKNSIYNLNTET